MGVLDATLIFVVPFGIDAVVIILAARNPERFWLYPLLATVGSLAGATLTFWIGQKIGEQGLDRFASRQRVDQVRRRLESSGAFTMAVPAIIPPPFPFKIFVLASGALKVDRTKFFVSVGVLRLLRFGIEAALATIYGEQITAWLETDVFNVVVAGFVVLAVLGSGVSLYQVIRKTRRQD
jgi:membrane protein YqaA with SNARE-associated domain